MIDYTNYIVYLNFITEKINKFFESQKPYIFCKKGCGYCCKKSQFPYSEIETKYLLQGLLKLSQEKVDIIQNKFLNIVKEREEFYKTHNEDEMFLYDCPFLVDDVCQVYENRGVICRAFGVMTIGVDGHMKVPFCCFKGLNYSNVYDPETRLISSEKYKELGVEEEPLAFNNHYLFLTDPDFEKMFNFEFGKKKPLIDWLIDLQDSNISE